MESTSSVGSPYTTAITVQRRPGGGTRRLSGKMVFRMGLPAGNEA
jgi:hypothetical protein